MRDHISSMRYPGAHPGPGRPLLTGGTAVRGGCNAYQEQFQEGVHHETTN